MNSMLKAGIVYAGLAYLIWGLFPVYWKMLEHVTADEILANRILWSFVFMVLFLFFTGKVKHLKGTLKDMKLNPKRAGALVLASLLVTSNWFLFIWAVNNERIIETSMGYYINPLMSVLLGVFILKEALSKAQILSFLLASAGVLVLTVSYGQFPWVSIGLAVTFALYGLAKKMIKVDAAIGLTLETTAVAPFALLYLGYLFNKENVSLFSGSAETDILLIGGGMITAVPLLLFAQGAQKIPLYMIGFLQYITPTMTLLLGIFVYHEPFTSVQLTAFSFIWSALAIFSLSQTKWYQRRQLLVSNEKSA
ncbi:chloramphenicol-sensitive protein RarD [Bacillus ectoiniformans]|uniref:EamA family transporter RarD n=1 Tax=Bacillus ectoiniformans TaxID=1494429 RepID=UPI00195BA8B1|nr:EamA family transporter RarD [Bacillus ectoiniformans]MBM7648812.1 chloramphenicol-sensitive protein RarD [Bacillus ectoiniformans]